MKKLVFVFVLCSIPALAFAQPAPASAPDARELCVKAMNDDPMFANSIIKVANEQTAAKHEQAAEAVAKNERHVILAYAAMWVIAALFVIFLWRRQQALKAELARLQRDLEAAIKEPAK